MSDRMIIALAALILVAVSLAFMKLLELSDDE